MALVWSALTQSSQARENEAALALAFNQRGGRAFHIAQVSRGRRVIDVLADGVADAMEHGATVTIVPLGPLVADLKRHLPEAITRGE